MSPTTEQIEDIYRGFDPKGSARIDAASNGGSKFLYYTSASTARSIFTKGELWLCSTICMNDHQEVDANFGTLAKESATFLGQALHEVISSVHKGLGDDLLIRTLAEWRTQMFQHTYIACVSEKTSLEGNDGRLTMWRGYGANAPVAIVLRSEEVLKRGAFQGLKMRPVNYWSSNDFQQHLQDAVRHIGANTNLLRALPYEQSKSLLFTWLSDFITCTKHRGFGEENEWRVRLELIQGEFAPKIASSFEDVRGVLQQVVKAKLFEESDRAKMIQSMVEKIIVGPMPYQIPVAIAMRETLREVGAADIPVVTSTIPYRRHQSS